MRYDEISVTVPASMAEMTADILREATGAGSWTDAPFTQPDLESDAVRDGRAETTVHVYVAESASAQLADAAYEALLRAGINRLVYTRGFDEEDWANAWKEHFDVERYGERLVVVPSWRTYEARDGDIVITLDPGMAFGTGQHETTRMCLEALEREVRPGARVLDLGCGSGILAIAAAKLGAAVVLALDIDEDCVRIARENATLNGAGAVRASSGSLGHAWPASELSREFDVIVANIVANPIIEMARALVAALSPAGTLIASGIIAAREDDVREALSDAGAAITNVRAMGEWRCLLARHA